MNNNTLFLYGASVQGIQDFIFKKNSLEEVIGASRLVEEVCTVKFAEKLGKTVEELRLDNNAIVNAAGNIKYIFDNYDSCQEVVRVFPKEVETVAPGITISQAVVEMTGEYVEFSAAVNELEKRLYIQRNKPMNHTSPRFMGVARSKETNLPAIKKEGEKLLDAASLQRINAYKKHFKETKGKKSKIMEYNTIIHADGNAMGALFSISGSDKDKLKRFSAGLDNLVKDCVEKAKISTTDNSESINCIINSGDDLTVMCDSKDALPFINSYLSLLENHSSDLLKDIFGEEPPYPCITACAGIAFIGYKNTFRDGYRIANLLCDLAKTDSFQHRKGNLHPSCILFHKHSGTVVGNLESSYYQTMHPANNHCFQFGPYYLNETNNRWTIKRFLDNAEKAKEEIGIRKNLNDWISWMYEDVDRSELQRKHITGFNGTEMFSKSTAPEIRNQANFYLGFDLLTYLTSTSDKKHN